MSDLAELKRRVDSAVEHLASAQDARRDQHESLVQLLADLEVKFDARHEELSYCHSRITDLEQANHQLGDLLDTVVHLIESGSIEDPTDPIFRASKMAADLVSFCAKDPSELRRAEIVSKKSMRAIDAEVIEDQPTPVLEPAVAAPLPQPELPAQDVAPAHPSIRKEPAPPPAPETSIAQPEPESERLSPDDIEIIDVDPVTPEAAAPIEAEPNVLETAMAAHKTDVAEQKQPAVAEEVVDALPPQAVAPTAPAADYTTTRYEDVGQEELDIEALLDDGVDESELPQPLVAATAAARGELAATIQGDEATLADALAQVADAVRSVSGEEPLALDMQEEPIHTAAAEQVLSDDDEMDFPGVETVVDFEIVDADGSADGAHDDVATEIEDEDDSVGGDLGGESDIKALMVRIQEAAEKARARSDTSEVGEPSTPPHVAEDTGTG